MKEFKLLSYQKLWIRSALPSTHPGVILKEFYLDESNKTIAEFARELGVSRKAISKIVNGRKSITPEMALRFAKAMNSSPQLWLNLQNNYDLWRLTQEAKEGKTTMT